MKNIRLIVPRVIGDVVKHPADGTIPVDGEIADQLIAENVAIDADVEFEMNEDRERDDLDDETMPELGRIVTKEGVPLHGATKKAEIIAAIRAHRASKEA